MSELFVQTDGGQYQKLAKVAEGETLEIKPTPTDATKWPADFARDLDFTINIKLTKKDTKKLRQIFMPNRKEEQRQRLRAAKRRNRQRRLLRWKDNTKTVPPYLQAIRRQMARIQRTVDALKKSLQPEIKQITDCVGKLQGVGFYQEKEEEAADERHS